MDASYKIVERVVIDPATYEPILVKGYITEKYIFNRIKSNKLA